MLKKKNIPNFKIKYHFIIITSSNSIHAFLRYISLYKKKYHKIPKVFVIGPETARKLNKNKFFSFYESKGNANSLVNTILTNTNLYDRGLWLCGRQRNNKIKEDLFVFKRFIDFKIVYEMKAVDKISKKLFESLEITEKIIFIVNSSRNVEILTQLLKKSKLFNKLNNKSVLVTMSETIYNKAYKCSWKKIKIICEKSRKLYIARFKQLIKDENLL